MPALSILGRAGGFWPYREKNMKKIKRISLAVAAVLAVAVLVLLALVWRVSSFSAEPAAGRVKAETRTFRTDTFSIDIPTSYEQQGLVGALRWADGYIIFREDWTPDREKAAAAYSQALTNALEQDGSGDDVSEDLGHPALVRYREYDDDFLGTWQAVMLLSVYFPHGRVIFSQMSSGPPDDPAALKELFLGRVKDFLSAYAMDEETPPEKPAGMRTRYGTVASQPRHGYAYSINFVAFSSGDDSIYLAVVPEEERQIKRPGFTSKIGRFFSEMDRTGYIPGTSLKDMAIDGRPGHEIVKKHPFFDDGEFTLEMEWSVEPQAEFGHGYSLQLSQTARQVTNDNMGDVYADWLTLLDGLKFETPADAYD